jgi:hypothetical protein
MDSKQNIDELKIFIQNDAEISDNHKKIIKDISYESLISLYSNISNSRELNFMQLFDILSSIMIFIENTKINGKKIDSDTKKYLVLYLGKFFIKHNIKDEIFLQLYEKYADDIIEKIIYSSIFLNVSSFTKRCCIN